MGASGRLARRFQDSRLTPLLALVALLLGVFAVLVTPREEEPQINVTMANVLIPFPGASVRDVEQMVAGPAEQVLGQIAGLEHVMSVSRPGMAILTVQFKVGVPRTEALVRLHDTLSANRDWLPPGLGVGEPIVKPKGIDDVPILAVTLYDQRREGSAYDLERIAHAMEAELKRVRGTREVATLGGPGHAINIDLDTAALRASGLTIGELSQAIRSANGGSAAGDLVSGNASVRIDVGEWFRDAADLGELVVAVRDGRPVYLRDLAHLSDGPPRPEHYVWYGTAGANAAEYPAVTLSVTKKPGENAVEVTRRLRERVASLHGTLIPAGVGVAISRDYGETANDKALKLIEKLLFATSTVVALVFFAMGRREALIVGVAVALTLTTTLFASWAWGFTLNRVSLFALVFSIGILVDDAIVVVENIHRHRLLEPDAPLLDLIPRAVDEVGGPTILATLTVIAALLPMAFVTGLMGPYMGPIPINASMGMLISLAVAFVLTPWLALRLFRHVRSGVPGEAHAGGAAARLMPWVRRIYSRFLDPVRGQRNRRLLWAAVVALILVSVALPILGLVMLKMLPFDNKSEIQVVVDMPVGTPVERTAEVLHALGGALAAMPEVKDYQAYAGLASPINFNGLVRQYYLRASSELGDVQVNLVDKHHRSDQSHVIATRMRPILARVGERYGANIKVVEVPPGPPVQAPIVAEIYGPDAAGREQLAASVRQVFGSTRGVVDVDSSTIAVAPRQVLAVDRAQAARLGVPQAAVVGTLRAGLVGEDAGFLHDGSKYPTPIRLRLPPDTQRSLAAASSLRVRAADGSNVVAGSLLRPVAATVEQPIYHKDLLPVSYVIGDMAGKVDSPLYGMFEMRGAITRLRGIDGGAVRDLFISQPQDAYRGYWIKWDGEWQITYETFRDMGAAYAVGLVLIYLLVVAQFGSYGLPLIIMAPIPLTIIGVMPGHALLGAPFTATSMIGMIALAGIIVRNSILLVDFIRLQVEAGMPVGEAVMSSVATRAQPIALTALAAMLGALFILDDPIFNGLAISLIFGILVSTVLTLVVIPLLYFAVYGHKTAVSVPSTGERP
ncbi:MAG: efflux RND transporter permease subunit [Proteobacteria bacterium]|nr:efflux RND transporter permease subunit [Pseudomonadota bacterium]